MRETPPAVLDHLADTDVPDPPHGYVLTWDETAERWVAAAGGVTAVGALVEAGTTTSAGLLTFRYGIDADGNPYFTDAGVDLAEAARMFADTDTATFYLEALL